MRKKIEKQRKARKPVLKTEEPVYLERCMDRFWKLVDKLDSFTVSIQPPNVPIALLKRLGPPTVWRGCKLNFYSEMERIYKLIEKEAEKTA